MFSAGRPLLDAGKAAPEASPYAGHIPSLDGIRAFAVVGVMASHLFPGNAHGWVERQMHHALEFGSNGVDLFFVLSGFLITGILYDSLDDGRFFRKFYARRALRIFPLYYGVLAIMACVVGAQYHRELWSYALYLQNTTALMYRTGTHLDVPRLPLSHFWSLAIEEQFYLVWPLVVYVLRDRKKLLIMSGAVLLLCPLLRFVLTAHGTFYYAVHQNTICRADSLSAGAALALLLRGRFHDALFRWAARLFLAGVVFVIVVQGILPALLKPIWVVPASMALGYSAFAITFSGLLLLCISGGRFQAVCSLPLLRWLGRYSYGIYVYHLILFGELQPFLRRFFEDHFLHSKGFSVMATGFTVAFISVCCAYVSYRWFERYFLKLKRYFDYRPHVDTVGQV